jgi:hypothetical protein
VLQGRPDIAKSERIRAVGGDWSATGLSSKQTIPFNRFRFAIRQGMSASQTEDTA